MKRFNNNRGFGIEIEFISSQPNMIIADLINDAGVNCVAESYNHLTRSYWKVVMDSSLNATSDHRYTGELVSPILYGEDGLADLKTVLKVLNENDCTVNRSCGIHVHHDLRNWFGDREESTTIRKKRFANNVNNFVSLVAKYEHCIYRLLPPSRQNNWCAPVRNMIRNYNNHGTYTYKQRTNCLERTFVQTAINGNTSRFSYLNVDRYCGLNFQNLWSRGAVEFRYHQGSTNYTKIKNWVVFTQAFVETAENSKSITYTNSLTRISVASAMQRLRRDLGLFRCENDEHLKECNEEIKRRFKKYKNQTMRRVSIMNAQ